VAEYAAASSGSGARVALFEDIRHDLGRLREIAQVASRHGFGPSLRRVPLLTRFASSAGADEADSPPGERFASMLEELGPTFVKLGQILSTRGDLLPPEFTQPLARLQDQVPPFPFDDVKRQIERELGGPVDELFDDFAPQPLASASMAQVHTATLKGTDTEVVVKVLRPGIDEQVRGDASFLVVLAQLLERLVEEASHYQVGSLAEEFEEGLSRELDLHAEARNLQAFRSLNEGREGVHVPFIVSDLCSQRVITMERIFGRRITDLVEDGDPARAQRIVERLVMLGYEHFYVDGLFHADPHPGNVLVTDDDNIAFIDFGLVGRVSRGTQDRMLLVIVALSLRDADSLARLLIRVGEAEGRVPLHAFRDAIARLLDRYLGLNVADINSSQVLADLVELSTNYGLRMPREFALLSKASIAIEGIVRTLHPGLNPSVQMAERSRELLLERMDPRDLTGSGLRTALQLGVLLQELPLQASQTLMDLERGNLQVRIVSEELDRLEHHLRGLGMTVFGGLLASALTLGGIYVLARYEATFMGVPILPAVAFLGAGAMFGVAFFWFLTGGRLPKVSLASLVRGRGRRRRRRDDA
jgi:ubiquinone biosynthesis protein